MNDRVYTSDPHREEAEACRKFWMTEWGVICPNHVQPTGTRLPSGKPVPYHCPACPVESYYGKLLFKDDAIPACPNQHTDSEGNLLPPILLEPVR